MVTYDTYAAETEDWIAAVGRAMVSFAEIELVTYKCLAHIPSDKIYQSSSRLEFSRRVDLIVEILEGPSPQPKVILDFITLLKSAKELAKTRNDIAHNPVMMNVYVNKTNGDVLLERSIATARVGRSIDISAAKEFAAEVEDLAAAMWLQIGKVAECPNQVWRV